MHTQLGMLGEDFGNLEQNLRAEISKLACQLVTKEELANLTEKLSELKKELNDSCDIDANDIDELQVRAKEHNEQAKQIE